MNASQAIHQEGLSARPLLALAPPPEGYLHCSECRTLTERKRPDQVTCGAKRCQSRRWYRAHRRDVRDANRARCAAWYEAHAEQHKANVAARARKQEPTWFVSDHAVQQWRARFGKPGDTMAESRDALLDDLRRAHPVTVDNTTGAEIWRGPRPRRARFIATRHEKTLDLVSVYPPFDGHRPARQAKSRDDGHRRK